MEGEGRGVKRGGSAAAVGRGGHGGGGTSQAREKAQPGQGPYCLHSIDEASSGLQLDRNPPQLAVQRAGADSPFRLVVSGPVQGKEQARSYGELEPIPERVLQPCGFQGCYLGHCSAD